MGDSLYLLFRKTELRQSNVLNTVLNEMEGLPSLDQEEVDTGPGCVHSFLQRNLMQMQVVLGMWLCASVPVIVHTENAPRDTSHS